ncbi:50S ribosomal protein 6, chloroplastic [Dorcoceras hygrometricum]|uniref:50S ribosomal protein 6, chloroplastic n=1 Tax=Dorcoceras hygrometricum TaxID=472368 RepID=A0A2Z7CWA9_9LAMI|nr:50S ribosomal protein 6, chloroplastic [Dorcoceras hygrometricum]
MSVSAIFGTRLEVPLPHRGGVFPIKQQSPPQRLVVGGGGGGLSVECSSRPEKKATKHHMKTRPRKSQPWDIRRRPTVYPPLPALPPDWTPVSGDATSPPQPAPSE